MAQNDYNENGSLHLGDGIGSSGLAMSTHSNSTQLSDAHSLPSTGTETVRKKVVAEVANQLSVAIKANLHPGQSMHLHTSELDEDPSTADIPTTGTETIDKEEADSSI